MKVGRGVSNVHKPIFYEPVPRCPSLFTFSHTHSIWAPLATQQVSKVEEGSFQNLRSMFWSNAITEFRYVVKFSAEQQTKILTCMWQETWTRGSYFEVRKTPYMFSVKNCSSSNNLPICSHFVIWTGAGVVHTKCDNGDLLKRRKVWINIYSCSGNWISSLISLP